MAVPAPRTAGDIGLLVLSQGAQQWVSLDREGMGSSRSREGWEEVGGWRGRAIGLPSDGLCYVGRRFGTKCAGCAQGISPSDLVRKARSKVFHLNCFTCMVCNKQLSTGEELYVIDENKFVCKDDYLSSSSLKEGSLNSGRGLAPPPARPALSALLPGAARPARSSRVPVTQRAALGRGGLGAGKGAAREPGRLDTRPALPLPSDSGAFCQAPPSRLELRDSLPRPLRSWSFLPAPGGL